jgi:hypothetical protein
LSTRLAAAVRGLPSSSSLVVPAKAGTQKQSDGALQLWIPAFAGKTIKEYLVII